MLYYSLSKLSTTMAPIDAGMAITIKRFRAMRGSSSIGNLFKQKSVMATTKLAKP